MGIYSGNNIFGSGYHYPDTLDSIMQDDNIEPSIYNDIEESGMLAIQDINENYNMIMQRIGINELAALEETGEEMVYTEGVVSSIWNTIKNFLKKIWEKIKSLFKRFMMIIDSYTKTDKEFLNKYRNQILSPKNMSDFTFKGYKWSEKAFNDTDKAMGECTAQSALMSAGAHFTTGASVDEYDKLSEKEDDTKEETRGAIIKILGGQGGKLSSSEFVKELKEVYRSGDTEKQDLDGKDINIHNIVGELSTSKEIKKGVNDAFKACKKSIEDDDKYVDRLQKTHIKTGVPGDKNKDVADFSNPQITSNTPGYHNNYDHYSEVEAEANNSDSARQIKLAIDRLVDKAQRTGTTSGSIDFKGNNISYSDINDLKDKAAQRFSRKYGTKKEDKASEQTTKGLGIALNTIRFCKELLMQINTAYLNAWKDRSRQNKAICIKIVSYNPKKESFTESYNGSYVGENFLANIQFK